MKRYRTTIVALTGLLALSLTMLPAVSQQEPIEDRVAALEQRVDRLETFHDPVDEPVIPDTIPYRKLNKDKGDYQIETKNLATGRQWWNAAYIGQWLPYAANAQWVNGDRVGYRCAYGFLEHEGEIVGRFTFQATEGARNPDGSTYVRINDRYMEEGERYYDGTKAAADAPPQLNDCKPNSGFDYEPWTGADERPRVVFWSGDNEVLDIRDYRNTSANVKFRLFDVTDTRATVVAYENDLPVIAVYYDSLGSGRVSADLP